MEDTQPNQLPERVSLPTEAVNEILSVFSQMPYREVAQLITKIQNEVQPIQGAPEGPTPRVVQMPVPKEQEIQE